MKILLFILLSTIASVSCIAQKRVADTVKTQTCAQSWQYFSLPDTIKGEVLFHEKANALCGTLAFASLTIIKTTLGDTARVLELCNTYKNFATHTTVKVAPAQKPPFGVILPFETPYACLIKKTCYGEITPYSP